MSEEKNTMKVNGNYLVANILQIFYITLKEEHHKGLEEHEDE